MRFGRWVTHHAVGNEDPLLVVGWPQTAPGNRWWSGVKMFTSGEVGVLYSWERCRTNEENSSSLLKRFYALSECCLHTGEIRNSWCWQTMQNQEWQQRDFLTADKSALIAYEVAPAKPRTKPRTNSVQSANQGRSTVVPTDVRDLVGKTWHPTPELGKLAEPENQWLSLLLL